MVFLGIAIVIAIVAWYFSEKQRILRALRGAPIVPIHAVSAGAVARIEGKVRVLGEPLRAPFSGRFCVFYEAIVEERRSNGKSSSWVTIIREVQANDFLLDDGTALARVESAGLRVVAVKDSERTSGVLNDASADLEAFLAKHGRKSQGWVFNKTLRYREGVFEPGERVTVLGSVRMEHDPDPTHAGMGYRDSPKRAVIVAMPSGQLLATDEAL